MDHGKNLGGLLLASALAAAPLPAATADEIFLRLDGFQGESLDARHKGEIEILSYTQSLTAPARGAPSSVGVTGKTPCGPGAVTVIKYVDQSSPKLILFALNQEHIKSAEVTFRKPGQLPTEYYKVRLDDVIITEVEQNNSRLNFPNPAPPKAIEKVSLVGQRFRFQYLVQQPDGKVAEGQPTVAWDCGRLR